MFNFKSAAATTLLLASCLPTVLGDECRAVGWQIQTAVKGSTQDDKGVNLYRADKKIGEAKKDRHWPGVCTDFMWVEGDELDAKFGWAASCSIHHFTECHGYYATQTHIKGEEPSKGSDVLGIAVGVDSACEIKFDF